MVAQRDPWPAGPRTVFGGDIVSRATLGRAERAGRIRRVATGFWTADMHSDLDEIIAANIWRIVAHHMPDAVVVDRTAARKGRIDNGVITVASDRRRPLSLPGVIVLPRPLVRHFSDMPWSDGLTTAAPARIVVDNLAPSRARNHAARTLTGTELVDWFNEQRVAWGEERFARVIADAMDLAEQVGVPDRAHALTAIIDGLATARNGHGQRRRGSTGHLLDVERSRVFDAAARHAETLTGHNVPNLPAPTVDGELPFFEAYFSNFIEGTEFTIDAAREIVASGKPPARRPEDGLDILGTWRCVVDPIGRAKTSTDPRDVVEIMRTRHATVMVGRPAIGPGEFKTESNRVGAIEFVHPHLVEGTLTHSLRHLANLPAGFPRAIYTMFVIAEVHPFTDGNGRAARLSMNAELSAINQCRIVVPTILRDDYIAGLRRATTSNGDLTVLAQVLLHAWRWTAAMPWDSPTATDGQLAATNALTDSPTAHANAVHLTIP